MTRTIWMVIAGAVLSLLGLTWWHSRQDERVEAAKQAALDSAAVATTRATNALAASERARAESDSLAAVAESAQDDAHAASRAANRLRAERERLMALVTAKDSGSPLPDTTALARANHALDLSVSESDSLRASVAHHETAEAAKDGQIAALGVALDTTSAALGQARGVLAQQSAVLKTMAPRCKIGPLPCPSRTLVAVGTALATLVVVKR